MGKIIFFKGLRLSDNSVQFTAIRKKKGVLQIRSYTWGLWAGAVHKAKHVSTSFADGSHFGENWQVVNDEGHLCTLLPRQVLSVTQDPKPCDVSRCVCIEGVHQPGSWTERETDKSQTFAGNLFMSRTRVSCTDLFCWVEPCSTWPPDKPVQHPPEWQPTLSYSISLAETERKTESS